jgi:enterochelin esterase-like enzyme
MYTQSARAQPAAVGHALGAVFALAMLGIGSALANGSTDDEDWCDSGGSEAPVCRVRPDADPGRLQAMLASGEAMQRTGDELTFVHRAAGDAVGMRGGLQYLLTPVPATDLWTVTVRVQSLDRLAFEYYFVPTGPAATPRSVPVQWRGPLAADDPEQAQPLLGALVEHVIASDFLPTPRGLSVYEAPAMGDAPLAATVYLADGQNVARFAAVIEPLIRSGRLPRLLLVGIHAAAGQQRSHEYIPGLRSGKEAFEAHQQFLLQEVLPYVERAYPVAGDRTARILFGCSNGADWAIGMALRHPGHFARVVAMSPAWEPRPGQPPAAQQVAFFLTAGTLEPEFHEAAQAWAEMFDRHGAVHVFRPAVAGHDTYAWTRMAPDAFAWTFEEAATHLAAAAVGAGEP